jgi:poly-gamma-glutamate synthesis protein (capsule biosynthesis protein)
MRRVLVGAAIAAILALPAAGEAAPVFHGEVKPIGPKIRERMVSWRPGCPVGIKNLRVLVFDHWGFDNKVGRGRLIIHKAEAHDVLGVMRKLFDKRFHMRKVWLVDAFGASDDRSMAADNTSAFNCRYVAGTTRWSEHAYGKAIDINPVENPYVDGSHVSPEKGRRYADRSLRKRGMIHANDKVVKAFKAIGWSWGGYWSGAKDYQHFSASGN